MFCYRITRAIPVEQIEAVRDAMHHYFARRDDQGVYATPALVAEELQNHTVVATIETLTSAIDYERSIARQRRLMGPDDGGSVNPLGTLRDAPCHAAAVGTWREIRRPSRTSSYEPV